MITGGLIHDDDREDEDLKDWHMMIARHSKTISIESIDYVCRYGSLKKVKKICRHIGKDNLYYVYATLLKYRRFDVVDEIYDRSHNNHWRFTDAFIKLLDIGYDATDDEIKEVVEYDEELFKRFMHYVAAEYMEGINRLYGYGTNVILKIAREYATIDVTGVWPHIPKETSETRRVDIAASINFSHLVVDVVKYMTDVSLVDELFAVSHGVLNSTSLMTDMCSSVITYNNAPIFDHLLHRDYKNICWADASHAGYKCKSPHIIDKLYRKCQGDEHRICHGIILHTNHTGLEVISKYPVPTPMYTCQSMHQWDYYFATRVVDLGFDEYFDPKAMVYIHYIARSVDERRMPYMKYMDDIITCYDGHWTPKNCASTILLSIIIDQYRKRMKPPSFTMKMIDVTIVCAD